MVGITFMVFITFMGDTTASTRIGVLGTFTLFHNINSSIYTTMLPFLTSYINTNYALHYFSNLHRTIYISPLGPVQTSCFCRAELNCSLVRL